MPCQAEGSTLSTGTGSVDSSSESQDGERLLKRSRCRSAFPKTIEMGCVKCSLSCFSNSINMQEQREETPLSLQVSMPRPFEMTAEFSIPKEH